MTATKVRRKKVTTKRAGKTEQNAQQETESKSETPIQPTASNGLQPSTLSGDTPDAAEATTEQPGDNPPPPDEKKQRGNNRPKVADNDVKLQIRVSPEVAEILGKAAAARRCPLSNYCAILLTDWALESDATPRLSPEEQAKAEAIYKAMFGDK